jgi:hypothetical protein
MTRDYNKQPRDDVRSSSRGQSPNRTGEERTPRPPRPRLNRETVDRAWESGAPTQHADYRTRSSNGQPSRNNWRNNQPSEHSSAQNGQRPYGPNGNQRSFERSPNSNFGTRPRSYNASRERYDNRRPSGNGPGSPSGFQKNGAYPGSRDNQQRQAQDQRPPFRESERNRGYQGRGPDEPRQRDNNRQTRDFTRDDRSPRSFERKPGNFERNGRPPRNFDPLTRDNERKPREFERGERPQRNYAGGNRPFYPAGQRDTHNPRWQSRPAARQDSSSRERPGVNGREGELFEGDYERFDTPKSQRNVKPERPSRESKTGDRTRTEPEERHVTRLPDGRVLKGPRPAQRKNAQFWTGIANETEELVKQVETLVTSDAPLVPVVSELAATPEVKPAIEDAVQVSAADKKKVKKAPRKARSRAASAIASSKKEAKKEKAAKPRSSGPKPSQHGFKWPSPQ